ncbi:hypothetical protein HMPREF1981_01229, partial [Bacteroides pyogenes F0041]
FFDILINNTSSTIILNRQFSCSPLFFCEGFCSGIFFKIESR